MALEIGTASARDGGPRNLFATSADGTGGEQRLTDDPAEQLPLAVSPDGKLLVFSQDDGEDSDIGVLSGGQWPVWAPDGRELFYWTTEALMAVSVEVEPSFQAAPAVMLFEDIGIVRGYGRTYDIAPDGKRFLIVREGDQSPFALTSTRIQLILN